MSDMTIQDAWLAKVMDAVQSGTFQFDISYFRIAEGGFQLVDAVAVVRDPDSTLTDVDVNENPSRYAATQLYSFQKTIVPTKITEVTSQSVQVECFVDPTEANDDGNGFAPEFWELGIFDSEDTMMGYLTFSSQPKTDTVALRHYATFTIAFVP